MPGYWRKILHLDLTNGKTWTEEPDEAFYRKHMGGRGFIAHYLLSETPAGVDDFVTAQSGAGPCTSMNTCRPRAWIDETAAS